MNSLHDPPEKKGYSPVLEEEEAIHLELRVVLKVQKDSTVQCL